MGKEQYSSKVYSFLARNGAVDYNKVNEVDFVNKMKQPEFAQSMYSFLQNAQKEGYLGTLKPYEEFVSEFGVTEIPSPQPSQVPGSEGGFPRPEELNTTNIMGATTVRQPDGGNIAYDVPVAGATGVPAENIYNPNRTPTNQPNATSAETQIAPLDQQAGQVQGGMPQGQGLGAGQFQITDTRGAEAKPPVASETPQMAGVQPQVTGVSGESVIPVSAPQSSEVNPYQFGVTKLGEFEAGLIGGIGSELRGISELGYSIDSKIVNALKGTPLEGSYSMLSKPEDSWIYQAGKGLENFAEKDLYRNPQYAGGLTGTVATALGQVGSIMMQGGLNPAGGIMKLGRGALTNRQLIANGVKKLFGRSSIAGGFQMVGAETQAARQLHKMANSMDKDAYVLERVTAGENAKDAGDSWESLRNTTEDEVASSIIPTALFAGSLEAIPLERLMARLGKPVTNVVIDAFKQGGVQGAEEAIQETLQQVILNAGIGQTYNEAQRLTNGLYESAEGGGATGFVLGAVLTALTGKRAKVRQQVQNGEISQQEAIAELEDINKAETLVQDKLQVVDNSLSLVSEEAKKTMESKEAQDYFETNKPSETNALVVMPTEVETTLDKIADNILISSEGLHSAYQWVNNAVKSTLNNQAISQGEKGATLNILSGMLADIDKANTEGQKFVDEVEAVSVQDRVPAVREGVKPLPAGQEPKGQATITPKGQGESIRQARRVRGGVNVLPSSGEVIVTPQSAQQQLTIQENETGKQEVPVLEGVRGSGNQGQVGQESTQLRTQEAGQAQANAEGEVETDNAIMSGEFTDVAKINNEDVSLPEKGFIISDVTLKPDSEKGKGSGQEVYKKALDKHKVLYSFFPVSEDAQRVQDKLVEKGIATIENITLPDGTEARVIRATSTTPQQVQAQPEVLADVESTAKALEGKDLSNIPRKAKGYEGTTEGTVGYGQREQRVKTKTFKVAIDGYGSISSQNFIEKLVRNGRLDKDFLSKKSNRFTDEFYNEQFNKNIDLFERQFDGTKEISEAYHKAKADGSNPELVKAVEELLTPKENAVQIESTAEVPVQPKAGVSPEVAEGKPEAKPESPAQQGQGEATATEAQGEVEINKRVQIPELNSSYIVTPISESDPFYKSGYRYLVTHSYPENLGEMGNYNEFWVKTIPTKQDIINSINDEIKFQIDELSNQQYLSGRDENILAELNKIGKPQETTTAPEAQGEVAGKPTTPTEAPGKTPATPETQEATAGEVDSKFASEYGISVDDVTAKLEEKRKVYDAYSLSDALKDLGVTAEKIKQAIADYTNIIITKILPTKTPTKKQKLESEYLKEGEINIQPVPKKLKSVPSTSTTNNEILVSIALGEKDNRYYAIHNNAEAKEVVATDALVMVIIKDDSINETINKNPDTGKKEDSIVYPKYRDIIPTKFKETTKQNAQELYNSVNGVDRATKMFDSSLSVNENKIPIRLKFGDSDVFVVAGNLLRALDPFVRAGIKDIEVKFTGESSKPIIITGGNIEALVMPVMMEGKGHSFKTLIDTSTKPQDQSTPQPTLSPINATDVAQVEKIENAPEKGRELALAKPTNKELKRAFDNSQDLSDRARKAGIYDGKTLKIGGQEITLDTPAKFKAFLLNDGNYKALSEAVKDVKPDTKQETIPEPTPKQVKKNADERMEDAKSTFVFPIGLNPKFKFDVRLPKKVVNFFKEYFRPQGLFTKELFGAKRRNEARIASQSERTKYKVKDLYSAIKKAYPKGVTTADVERMNDFLQGNPVELPPALYKPLEAMREHIDELSKLMIREGIIDEKLVPVFDANMGIYTTRTYKIHNDPETWMNYIANTPEGQQLRNNAVNWLREQYEAKADRIDEIADKAEAQGTNLMRRAELSETSDPEQARKYEDRAEALFIRAENLRAKSEALRQGDFDAKIDAFLHAESMPLDIVKKGNVGAKDLGILKKRSDIDEVMRMLMGEEKDPITNYMMSVAKMSALISNNQFLNEAKVQGLKDGTFTKDERGKNIEKIASEGTESMNPLNGLYTTPEIAQAFKEYGEIVNSPWYIDSLLRINGFIKMNKTLLSQQTHIRNFTSNPIIELANGAFRIGKLKESALSQYENIFGLPEGERRVKYREYIERLTKLGVLDQGANYRDALSFYEDMKGGKFDYQKVIEPKLTKLGKTTFGKIKEAYKAEDDFWKVYAFENERATLKEAYGDTKTDQELDEMAAEKVLKTRINYNMSPKIIQAIKRIPFLGTFPTFPAEIIRITANIPQVAVEEMKSGNKVLQKQGAKRMAGFMAAMVGVAGLNKLINYALGMDDEEEEARKKFLAPWSQNSTLIWLSKDSYIDTGYSDAFNVIKKPLVALARGTDLASGGVDALLQAIDPFVSEEIGYKTIESIKNNRDEYDNPIYDESASPTTKFYQVLSFALKKSEPGALTQIKRAYKGETGELAEKGQKYNTFDEILNATTGQKTTTIDWDNAILFKLKAEVEKIKDSNSFYNKANRQLNKDDVQGRKDQAEITNLAVEQSYNNLVDYYKSAQTIGYKPQQIVNMMKDAGASTDIIQSIVYNKPYKNYLIILEDGTVLDRDIQRKLRQ